MEKPMLQRTQEGRRIEANSFAIIDAEAGDHSWPPAAWEIVRRVVHATADFEFVATMALHPEAIPAGIAALRRGAPIVVDVGMIAAGLNRHRLAHFGCAVHHFIADPEVVARAEARGTTRARAAMRHAAERGLLADCVVAVGNAPTALLELLAIIAEGGPRPALVVGVPVGFVSAAEAKEGLAAQDVVPWIVARGRKGGTPVAVAVLHALMTLAERGQ